jgi:RNA polymerase sigma-70 factor, ECF subfamily
MSTAAAGAKDDAAFRKLVEPHRRELHAHCYRMLGSIHDADDALQDALLRAWRGLSRFEGRSSLRSWLYRIATNTCLDLVSRRPKRMLALDHAPAADPHEGPGAPLVESVWVEPYPSEELGLDEGRLSPDARYEQLESVELAFIAALQHLPARQRAVLIMREVLGFSAREVADTLDTSTASVNSALQRARAAVDERLPERSQQATLRSLDDDELRELVSSYVEAWERGDVEGVVSMLTEEATVMMPPMATWYRGRDAIEVFLRDWAFAKRWARDRERFESGERRVRLLPARASGQLAYGAYNYDAERGAYLPYALQVLAFDGPRIGDITGFVTPQLFPRFGLPDALS